MTSQIFADGALEGQVIAVTGGGTGLGRAAAAELLACGASVVICGRREEVLAEAADELGPRCSWVAGDVREAADAERIVDACLERHGRLDTLVNNAGGQYFVPAEAIALKGWRAVTRLNVGGTLTMATAAYDRAMRPAGGGMVINVTLSPHHGLAGMTHSSAARAAVEGATRELAAAWAPDGVAVCAAAAGHFDTPALDKYPESVRTAAARTVPLGRLGRVEEHAWLIALLASPLGRRLSGSVVTLDGARDNWFGPWPPAGMADESGEVPTEERRRG
ncbi:SDR family oxidoreductase [Capillimicrobium parvum]|uniref:Peroxisomal trans-2-enoyl-CoA reductase n=1 Tax=Capillimicrobium parvum TaxID=2884022 RepID=A0A9E6XWP3_9ACTN|nr:SDR family oxidoreductase [Capillimicrobium parvum]UGS35498.1 putative 2,4-dienoyl-CoA reductase [Capillimicrobium parvum]